MISIVCVCLGVILVTDAKPDVRPILNQYDWLQTLRFEYVGKPKISRQKLEGLPLDEMKKQMEIVRNQLQCSYVFTSMLHMYLTRAFFVNHEIREQSANAVLFISEAAQILSIVKNIPEFGSAVELMWMVYLYAERIAKYQQSELLKTYAESNKLHGHVKDVDLYTNSPDVKTIVSIHGAVTTLAEEFTVVNECKLYAKDSGRVEGKSYADKVAEIVNPSEEIQTNTTLVLLLMNDNKELFKSQTQHNDERNLKTSGKTEFLMEQLYLNGVLDKSSVMNNFFVKFRVSVEWDALNKYLRFHYDIAVNNRVSLHKQVYSLGTFQYHFVQMLKIVMLRITLKHYVHLKKITWPCKINRYKTKMYRYLKDFAAFLKITQHDDIKPLIQTFQLSSLSAYTQDQIERPTKTVIGLLGIVQSKLDVDLKLTEPMVMADDYLKNSMSRLAEIAEEIGMKIPKNPMTGSIRESILNTKVFLAYVRHVLRGVDFTIVNSLMHVKSTDTFDRLKELEQIEQQNFQKDVENSEK